MVVYLRKRERMSTPYDNVFFQLLNCTLDYAIVNYNQRLMLPMERYAITLMFYKVGEA